MDNMAFSLPFCLGRQGLTGLLQAGPWVSLPGPGLWWFGWSGIMASGSL